jgi:hypothetical protein
MRLSLTWYIGWCQRPQRQWSGFDCGTFVLADMVSYMKDAVPSPMTQMDMEEWRGTLMGAMMGLEETTRGGQVTDVNERKEKMIVIE